MTKYSKVKGFYIYLTLNSLIQVLYLCKAHDRDRAIYANAVLPILGVNIEFQSTVEKVFTN